MKISVVMIVLNEEKNIAPALDSVKWADERIVVDGGSTDKTIEIAKHKGASVFSNSFLDFATQKNCALKQASCEWVFFLDADERCDEALQHEIIELAKKGARHHGYFIKRRNFFLSKELRFGNHANDYQMRFFKREGARFQNRVHEIVKLEGPSNRLKSGAILHYTKSTLSDYFRRFEQYTDLEAQSLIQSGQRITRWDCIWKPPGRFLYFYLLKGGCLDGFHGFAYHLLSFFYYFVKLLKARERQNGI